MSDSDAFWLAFDVATIVICAWINIERLWGDGK